MEIYEKYGKQLFSIAGIEVTVQVSQRKDQIKDYVMNHNLDMFDSVGCVGGDGTVSELFNGLVLRECALETIDADDIKQNLPKPSLPVAIIPGRFGISLCYYKINAASDFLLPFLAIITCFKLNVGLFS